MCRLELGLHLLDLYFRGERESSILGVRMPIGGLQVRVGGFSGGEARVSLFGWFKVLL